MSNIYNVNCACLRYIVPFKYEDSFEKALYKVESQKEIKISIDKKSGEDKTKERILWERKKVTLDGPESDLYSYIRNEFRFDNDKESLSEHKTGCEWILKGSEESTEKEKKINVFKKQSRKKKEEIVKHKLRELHVRNVKRRVMEKCSLLWGCLHC